MEDGQLVYCINLDGTEAVYFSLEDLQYSIGIELENLSKEDCEDYEFKVYAKWMSSNELDVLPEFNGF